MSGPEFVDHPYATAGIGLAIPPTLPKFGIPVGLRKDGQRMYVNIPEWQRLELTNSTAVLLLGAIGNGKTTLAKLIVYWLRSLRTEPGNADSRLHRVWVDDTKPHEWDSIAEAYGCKSWTLGSFSFNPLGSDLTISDMEQILRLILAQVVERPLTTNQLSVLRGALQELMRRQIEPSLRSLTILLNDQEREFSIPLFDGSDEQLQLPKEELAGLRQQMTSLLSQVLNGPYRRIFGDKTDLGLTQALAQQMVYVDYTDIPEEAAR